MQYETFNNLFLGFVFCRSLHSQLSTVTQQMTSLQKHFEGDPDASRSFSEEESRSTEQLMQIIKYLRREKEILTSKIDVVQVGK